MSEILVHNNWDPLEEIWLGDVWPEHFYDDLSPEVRDSFYQITEWTKHDLNNIQKKLEEFNVVVKRPVISNDKSLYLDPQNDNKLLKPPITPRDANSVIGNKLFFSDYSLKSCYDPLLKDYPEENIIKNKFISGAGTVKLGKDLILDNHIDWKKLDNVYEDFYQRQHVLAELMDDYRLHYSTNGGHTDGCFMPLKEGLLLTTEYWSDYDLMFPGWNTINLSKPTYDGFHAFNGVNSNRWLVPGTSYSAHFNSYVEEYCPEWIGNYTETYFEVNTVMIDEKNMLCMGEHDILFKELEQHGITCHVVPFRPRTFWDGGLHCITLDIRRKAVMKDYFPERGDNGISSILTEHFNNDSEAFKIGYEHWKTSKGLA
jgi:hypothetical protein